MMRMCIASDTDGCLLYILDEKERRKIQGNANGVDGLPYETETFYVHCMCVPITGRAHFGRDIQVTETLAHEI